MTESATNDIRAAARRLLADGTVSVVIGYGDAGPNRTVPIFARTAAQADRLVVSHSALNNLTVYLTRALRPVGGRIAIVAKGCDVRALVMLMSESQIAREDVYVIGVACAGVTTSMGQPMSAETVAAKCRDCIVRTPPLYDELVGVQTEPPATDDALERRIAEIEAMSANERFDYWAAELEMCTRCYACRQVCPLCYCTQCIVDRSVPQWIETSASPRANLSWNLTRAFHLAGRCVGCNECERACPAGIPLSLLNRQLAATALREFGYVPGIDPAAPALVGSYDLADREEYIR